MQISDSIKSLSFKPLITGLLISAGLSLLIHFGVLITYNYLPWSILFLAGLIIISSLVFWINMKYEHMLDLNEVFFKTISFDMKTVAGFPKFFLRYLRSLNLYLGAFAAISALLSALWAVPALIIYMAIHPDQPVALLKGSVFFLSAGICISYFVSNKDGFPSVADKVAFFAGALTGTVGVIKMLS